MPTTSTGGATSGNWLTRNLLIAMRPRPISRMMTTMAAIGRLMLKSERNMLASRSGAGRRRGRGRGRLGQLVLLAVGQRRARRAQHAVAGLDAREHRHVAQARVTVAQRHGRLGQHALAEPPDVGLVAFL